MKLCEYSYNVLYIIPPEESVGNIIDATTLSHSSDAHGSNRTFTSLRLKPEGHGNMQYSYDSQSR
jgi:hypothetical protein